MIFALAVMDDVALGRMDADFEPARPAGALALPHIKGIH
jgi:hypothetical protein